MVLKLDGNSEVGAHTWRNLYYSICLRHLIRSRAFTNRMVFLRKYSFPSCVRIVFWVAIIYKYHDFARLGGKFQIHLNINVRQESLKAAKGRKKGVMVYIYIYIRTIRTIYISWFSKLRIPIHKDKMWAISMHIRRIGEGFSDLVMIDWLSIPRKPWVLFSKHFFILGKIDLSIIKYIE